MEVPKQLFIENLSPEQIAIIEARMRPGQFSHAGFLNQTQSLRELIEDDAKLLEQYGITHKQVGDRLESLMGQALRQWDLASRSGGNYFDIRDNGALVDTFLKIFAVGWRGSQQCPWFYETKPVKYGHTIYNCGSGSHDFTIKNERQGREIRFPELMAHLVRDHHFFEGDTTYRLNPEDAITVLELKPGVDYAPKTETETLWRSWGSTNDIARNFSGSQELMKSAERTINLSPKVKIYIAGDSGVIIAKEHLELKEPVRIDETEVIMYNSIYQGQHILRRIEHKYITG